MSPEFAAQIGSPIRALAQFNGKRLIDLVIGALLDADRNAPISVVGDIPDSPAFARVADQGDFVTNIIAGVSLHTGSDWILITSADMPYLTGPIISQFLHDALAAANAKDVEIVYPVVPVAMCYEQFPGIKRTAVKLREGQFTGGNLMLARPSFFLDRRDLLSRAFAARKNPFQLAWMLGLGTVARLTVSQIIAPGALSVSMLEDRVGKLVQGKVAALISDSPQIATDLDRPSDFAAAAAFATTEP